jgi:hypothetical protein
MEMSAAEVYPVRVDASLDASLSRWLWLVKWVLRQSPGTVDTYG